MSFMDDENDNNMPSDEISMEDQDWTDELLDNLDDAFIAIDNLNENMHLYKNI